MVLMECLIASERLVKYPLQMDLSSKLISLEDNLTVIESLAIVSQITAYVAQLFIVFPALKNSVYLEVVKKNSAT